jgi:hypothetical protein
MLKRIFIQLANLIILAFLTSATACSQENYLPTSGGNDSISVSYIYGSSLDGCLKFKTNGANGFLFDGGSGGISILGLINVDTLWLGVGSTVGYISLGSSYSSPEHTLTINGLSITRYGRPIEKEILIPLLSITGDNTTRVINVQTALLDSSSTASGRYVLAHYWISNSSFGSPSEPSGAQSYALTAGTNFGTVSTSTINTAFSNSSGQFQFTITTSETGLDATVYFHIEIQGIIYVISGTIKTNGQG